MGFRKENGFKEGLSFFRVVVHQDGLLAMWSFNKVVFHQADHSSGSYFNRMSFIRVVFQQGIIHRGHLHQGGLSTCHSSGSSSSWWSFIMVVIHQDCLSTGCPQGHLHQGGHSSGWSLIRVVFLQGSTVHANTCTMTGDMIYLYNVWHIQASQKRRKPSR